MTTKTITTCDVCEVESDDAHGWFNGTIELDASTPLSDGVRAIVFNGDMCPTCAERLVDALIEACESKLERIREEAAGS